MQLDTNNIRLDGKVAVVTGSATGIGLATAQTLANAGARVVLSDIDSDRGSAVASDLNATNPGCALFLHCDVTNESSCATFWRQVTDHWGGVDILVNAAGVTVRADVTNLDLADWNKVLTTNLTSVFLMAKAAIPIMGHRGGGAIVNVASGWGLVGGAQAAAYCASKGGVVLLTKAMAIDHGPQGIRVNSVCPGDTDTEMLTTEARQLSLPDNALRDAAHERPLQRVGKPGEIANAILFLASDLASFVTGDALVVDGGGLAGSS